METCLRSRRNLIKMECFMQIKIVLQIMGLMSIIITSINLSFHQVLHPRIEEAQSFLKMARQTSTIMELEIWVEVI
jgi:hypothetical protein